MTKSRVAATNVEDALLYLTFKKTLRRKSREGNDEKQSLIINLTFLPGMKLRAHISITARSLKVVTQGSTCRPLGVLTMFSIVGKRK